LHEEVQESPQGAAILTRFVSAFLTPVYSFTALE
ncbi:hypothetical protein ACTXQV_76140, partial [Klebsiella pneumoniae]